MTKSLSSKDLINHLKTNPGSYIEVGYCNDKNPDVEQIGKMIGFPHLYNKLQQPIIYGDIKETHYCTNAKVRKNSPSSLLSNESLIINSRITVGRVDILTLILNPYKNF